MRESLEKTRELAAKWELRCERAREGGGEGGGVRELAAKRELQCGRGGEG
jgi:hypothetical protein